MDGATATTTLPTHGSNVPKIPSPEVLRDLLADENRDISTRAEELVAALARTPAVTDDESCGKVSDFIKQIDAAIKLTEARRTTAKAPALDAGRAIDGFFKPLDDKLTKARKTLKDRVEAYLRHKAEVERKRREDEARAAEEARKAAEKAALAAIEQAPEAVAEQALERATDAQFFETQAKIATEAKPAEMARTRGELGSMATLATTWAVEITDLSKIPLETLRGHISQDAIEKALRSYLRTLPKPVTVEMPGVRFFEQSSAVFR